MSTMNNPLDLLMNVDELQLLDDEQNYPGQFDQTNVDVNKDIVLGLDKTSGVPIYSLAGDVEEQPLKSGENGDLHYNLNSNSTQNIGFLANKSQTKLYPSKLPRLVISKEYSHYISKLFEIYNNLGEDHRTFSKPTIGLISRSSRIEHNQTVNLALETLVTELEFYIDSIKHIDTEFDKFIELEDCLTILNCMKTFYFTVEGDMDDDNQRNDFMDRLLNWVNRSDGEPSEQLIEKVFSTSGEGQKHVYNSSSFWKLINKLLLRGLFTQAKGCLNRSGIISSLESQCEVSRNAIHDMIALLEQYPKDSPSAYRNWKSLILELQQTFSNSETKINGELRDNIEDSLLLLSGNQSKIFQYSSTWYESFCGLMLYYIPSNKLLTEYLQLSLDACPLNVTNIWEQPCVDIINGKIFSILPILESLDTCTTAFVAGLCDAKGLLEDYSYANDASQNETIEDLLSRKNGMASYLLDNFAFELCSHDDKTLWPVAIGLISISPVNSSNAIRAAISELLPRYPFSTNDDIEWMLTICAKWRLPEVSKKIFLTVANNLLSEGNLIEAITNFSKAGAFDLVKHHAWMIFETSLLSKEPVDDIILTAIVKNETNNIIPNELSHSLVTDAMRQALSPYAVLYEFYELLKMKEMKEALNKIRSLIEFQYLPKKYFVILLVQFLFPLFILKDEFKMDEDVILSVIERCDEMLKAEDAELQKVYSEIIQNVKENEEITLPANLSLFEQTLRKKLNIKLCQEYM
ncbi:hypothetical protein TPHA_0O00360 [Tetrapisispora phaffii CBS 4417]|uniref:Nuclear pore complex protein Nup85 n=1 Tax=Tetrapisispora phaffii (strain ATCC 24235 / CBS 4417 / NBRC 1672 / NRRL Y-8282 / UCD 70-5) TaxID=1071381 RepID=G8C1H9_TETPH|nr:hypothetical protein TPHA_0O00360 [Tetrapisispora phaffii CBS 4417]CCE66007.1 hypothetical protein TPHA_0O00360 [Tetrapisispora phaffii CBS 4417]